MHRRIRTRNAPRTGLTAVVALAAALVALAGCATRSSGPTGAPGPGKQGRPEVPYAPSPAGPGDAGGARPLASDEVLAGEQPLSTFAMDVDTASYSYARRQLRHDQRPAPATVRPEEFVNAFRQDYREPDGNGFTLQIDGARLPGTHRPVPGPTGSDGQPGSLRLMRVGLRTRAEDPATRANAALTFVVDVSGSMAEPGKLDLVKDALHTLVDRLRPDDAVAIVAYDDRARTLREMTPVRDRTALLAAVDRLRPGGSTNLEAGLTEGYRVARAGFRAGATNRVILLSDGLANVGSTEPEPILRAVREAAGKQITLLGVGVGGEYGDALMEQLADRGDGFVVYLSEPAEARRVFVEQLPATLAVRALDAKVQVSFNPAAVLSYRLIGYDNRVLSAEDFRNDRVDGGEVGPGHSVTALYAVRLRPDAAQNRSIGVAQARIRWQDPQSREPDEAVTAVRVADLDAAFGSAAPRLRVCYAAAYFAEVLRAGRHADEVLLVELTRVASDAAATTGDPDVRELAELMQRAQRWAH